MRPGWLPAILRCRGRSASNRSRTRWRRARRIYLASFVIGFAVGRRMGRGRNDVLPRGPVAQIEFPTALAAERGLGILQADRPFANRTLHRLTGGNLVRDHEGRGYLKESWRYSWLRS